MLGAADKKIGDRDTLVEAFKALTPPAAVGTSVLSRVQKQRKHPLRGGQKRGQWNTERYAVRANHVEQILDQLGCGLPVVDAFAEAGNHRFPRWWGSDGVETDAFTQDWKHAGLLWCNLPFSMFVEVVKKSE